MSFGSPFGQELILPALWQGLWQAFAAMGIMVGALGNGMLQDMFGRKIMFAVGGSISAVGRLNPSPYTTSYKDSLVPIQRLRLPLCPPTQNLSTQGGESFSLPSSSWALPWAS